MNQKLAYQAVAIGTSAGGLAVLSKLIPKLPSDFSLSVFVVQHLKADSDDFLAQYLNQRSALEVKEAMDKEVIKPSTVYVAPANYHLFIEEDKTLSLSCDSKVNYSRPSIDVLFESAALAYRKSLIGIVLTGANSDGSLGLKKIHEQGGCALVQDPKTAEAVVMPQAAIEAVETSLILSIDEMVSFLIHQL